MPAATSRFPTRLTPLARAALGALLWLGAAGPGVAHEYAAGTLRIVHPWARATPNGARVAGGYVTLTNTGAAPETLTGGTLEAAGRAEVHRMSVAGGVMRMGPVEGGLRIGPGETVILKPGDLHLMFLDLKAPLRKGDRVRGALTFERAGTVPVTFEVEGIAAGAPGHGHDH